MATFSLFHLRNDESFEGKIAHGEASVSLPGSTNWKSIQEACL